MQRGFPSASLLHKEVSVVPHWVHSGLLGAPGMVRESRDVLRVRDVGDWRLISLLPGPVGIVLAFARLLFEGLWSLVEF